MPPPPPPTYIIELKIVPRDKVKMFKFEDEL